MVEKALTFGPHGQRSKDLRHPLFRSLFAGVVFGALILTAGLQATPAYAAGVVGTGTPESCTEAALNAALTGGGTVTFNCGPNPATITLSAQKSIVADTVIDGGGSVSLSAHGSRHFLVNAGASLNVSNITCAMVSPTGTAARSSTAARWSLAIRC